MEVLLHTQEKIVEHIQNYERYITDSRRAVTVRRFLTRCKTEQDRAKVDPEGYLGNPLNAFALITRLTRDLDYVEKILNETTAGMKYVPDNSLAYPSEEDVTGVVEGMARLQLMYDLDVKKVANGTLTSYSTRNPRFIEYTTPMTSCDCYELGLIEYHKNDRSRNIAWMKEALKRYEHEVDCTISKVDMYDRLSGDYFFMGEQEAAKYWIERRIDASPTDPQNKRYKQVLNLMREIKAINKATPISTASNTEIELYPGLCLKYYFRFYASLTCYYAHGPHAFLVLAPMKAERLHLSPEILMFHDVITDDEIKEVQALAKPRFEQAKATKKEGIVNDNYCVHQVAWIPDVWSKATLRVAQRVAQFSGLVVNPNTTEDFQVANYGTGGYYGPHYDFIQPLSTTVTGKRFATTLFYITDVAEGGATVFTKLGLSVFPVKNAAIFWWNLDPSGNDDFNTQHAACPVLRGSRWGWYFKAHSS
ncbi:2OG-Fe(II) oxygenase superfamily domain-containing protein [Phthorimaea operculella]|nr:2OG-Fe(II) oxygenase superfamily domain-containing protein [Phthorimaea operculella]